MNQDYCNIMWTTDSTGNKKLQQWVFFIPLLIVLLFTLSVILLAPTPPQPKQMFIPSRPTAPAAKQEPAKPAQVTLTLQNPSTITVISGPSGIASVTVVQEKAPKPHQERNMQMPAWRPTTAPQSSQLRQDRPQGPRPIQHGPGGTETSQDYR